MGATSSPQVPLVLSIAGSDSGGGAGIQADLKTFAALGVFGTTAITCVTAQNPDGVRGIEAMDPDMVALQIEAVAQGFPISAAKTGMLYAAPIVCAVAQAVCKHNIPHLVVDPVMAATSGGRLLRDDAVEAVLGELVPMAEVVTPNLDEAEILCGHPLASADDVRDGAREIGERYGVACVLKGGHLAGPEVVDVLYDHGCMRTCRSPRIDAAETHGTGCTFSAALAAMLGGGCPLGEAVERTHAFVVRALAGALRVGTHRPLAIGTGEGRS